MIGRLFSVLVPLTLVLIGVGALAAPRTGSAQYGIPTDDRRAHALIRAMGIRDVALGGVMALLALDGVRGRLGWAMFVLALLALVDLALVLAERRAANGAPLFNRSCWLHAAGAIGLCVVGVVLHAGG